MGYQTRNQVDDKWSVEKTKRKVSKWRDVEFSSSAFLKWDRLCLEAVVPLTGLGMDKSG